MILVVVKKDGSVIGKEAYAGDTSGIQARLDVRKNEDKSLSFDLYDDSSCATFEAVPLKTQDQNDWNTAKALGTGSAISFLAKRLGLE